MSELEDDFRLLPKIKGKNIKTTEAEPINKLPRKSTGGEEKPTFKTKSGDTNNTDAEPINKSPERNSAGEEKPSTSLDQPSIQITDSSFPDVLLFGTPKVNPKTARGIFGKIANKRIALDLQYPKTLAIYGYMGSGKSYLAGVLTEMLPTPIKNISHFPGTESAVIIFNFRQELNTRFEYGSYTQKNNDSAQNQILKEFYKSGPEAIDPDKLQVFAYKGTRTKRAEDYRGLLVNNLVFKPSMLSADDWMLLMGTPDKEALYIHKIKSILETLDEDDELTIPNLKREIEISNLSKQQMGLIETRFSLCDKYLSETDGIDWEDAIKPGTITILDFRRSFMTPEDAMRLVLIAFRGIQKMEKNVSKFLLFDEFHEYYNPNFSEQFERCRRMVRHSSTTLCIATQNTEKMDKKVFETFKNKIIFNIEKTSWKKLCDADPELTSISYEQISNLKKEAGECIIKFDECNDAGYRNQPIQVNIRPRVTEHGGHTKQ